ncbi:glycosyltransferase family 2 protein [Xylona heveae TC161]|uniref:dolichyl-phosphate beta-glucosyltransferase n=1 Tax=Xylona heveae (strain CBS 132557 / TC161) TaxID=1328760 RepID=A0A165H2X0_XYLHT|nr:glycosyltransferase family 2 protein [Xylona heveae TC161]KZF22912.1 glycosyltransferase family 2 protein [Xylona heveae TC161]
MGYANGVAGTLYELLNLIQAAPLPLLILLLVTLTVGGASFLYVAILIVAPTPRPPRRSEKTYRTILPDGSTSSPKQLPCWKDQYDAQKEAAHKKGDFSEENVELEAPEIFMSVVVPAFNEEERLAIMLEEAVVYLKSTYHGANKSNGELEPERREVTNTAARHAQSKNTPPNRAIPKPFHGWEILVVSDGSTDKTVETALTFARNHHLSEVQQRGDETVISAKDSATVEGSIRVVSLEENRGKGGAVTHGLRHVRGCYAIFADADGATQFDDLGKLVKECQKVEDPQGRGIAIGSRAHLVGSEAVVKRSFLRNFLMHSFHLLLRILTPPATAAIRDTQCGFKLFSRASLPYIIPYMHSEGWIFDVEMLMLAESANIPMAEVAVCWKEIKGSKLNVIWDSLGMAWGLAVLRAAWGVGVYRRS